MDLTAAMRKPKEPYFLGTIVLTKSENNTLEIADGQQRLATTAMLITAIRDWFRSKGDTMIVQSIENDFLFTIDRKERVRIPRLTLNLDDNEFFRNKIIEPQHNKIEQEAVRRSHKLMSQSFEEIKKHIQAIEKVNGEQNTKQILNDWTDYLQQNANVVKLIVSNSQNAFKMFETLNDRGLKTSQADLVKNHLFKIAENRLPEAQKLWSSMKGAIETVSDEDDITMDFLKAACCIIAGITAEKEVMSVIDEKVKNKTECISILTLFEELSKDYAAILNPDHQKWNIYEHDVRKSIQTINLFGGIQISPLMLAIARYFKKQDVSTSFRKLISWSVRYMISGVRGGKLDIVFSRLANAIYNEEIKNELQLKAAAAKDIIGDSEFKDNFERAKVNKAKLARYYLRALETSARQETDPEFIPNDDIVINLEHIMPLSANSHWPELSPQNVEMYCNRIGNMALLQANKNSDIGNLSFTEKKKIYSKSNFLLTNQLAQLNRWDTSEIENRQKVLANFAVITWPL
jgi:uncharacterized protein with ParB-like and HNH nuclease domain